MSIAGKSNLDGACVLCDEHTCSARFTPRRRDTGVVVHMGLEFSVDEARTRARRGGWQHVPSPSPGLGARDFCPKHKRPLETA